MENSIHEPVPSVGVKFKPIENKQTGDNPYRVATEGPMDHRRNIDRLMAMLKNNSKDKVKNGSGCEKMIECFEKMNKKRSLGN